MKEFDKEIMTWRYIFITSEMFDCEDFQSFIKEEFYWLVSNKIKIFVHKSAEQSIKTEYGHNALIALRDFGQVIDEFGQDANERYMSDLIQKMISCDLTSPVTVMTSSKDIVNNINIINSMTSLRIPTIETVVFDEASDSNEEDKTDYMKIMSLFKY